MSTFLIVAAGIAVAALLFSQRPGPLVSPEAARQLLEEGALLVDVRSAGEFQAGHIDGAINLPVDKIDANLAKLEPKSRPVVVYCQSGGRSGRAKRSLEGHGFAKVVNLGAMSRWR